MAKAVIGVDLCLPQAQEIVKGKSAAPAAPLSR
jgi:hypothetical protein